jgi:hypothetical protein
MKKSPKIPKNMARNLLVVVDIGAVGDTEDSRAEQILVEVEEQNLQEPKSDRNFKTNEATKNRIFSHLWIAGLGRITWIIAWLWRIHWLLLSIIRLLIWI